MRLLRTPVVALKWLFVAVAALLWITVVPIVELVREVVGRLLRGVSQRR
jgi:hypothetical protein